MLSIKRRSVSLSNVQLASSFVSHAVGAPSLMGGKYAARMGSKMNGVNPRIMAPMHTSTSFHRSSVRQRVVSSAMPAAGSGRNPAGWLAYPNPRRKQTRMMSRSAPGASGSSTHSMMIQETMVKKSSEMV